MPTDDRSRTADAPSAVSPSSLSEPVAGADQDPERNAIEAAVFRRLLAHLDQRTDVQNIDLMNLAGFCRNCLSKWYAAAAEARGTTLDYELARERVYGMPYADWKVRYQKEASAVQQAAFSDSQANSH